MWVPVYCFIMVQFHLRAIKGCPLAQCSLCPSEAGSHTWVPLEHVCVSVCSGNSRILIKNAEYFNWLQTRIPNAVKSSEIASITSHFSTSTRLLAFIYYINSPVSPLAVQSLQDKEIWDPCFPFHLFLTHPQFNLPVA